MRKGMIRRGEGGGAARGGPLGSPVVPCSFLCTDDSLHHTLTRPVTSYQPHPRATLKALPTLPNRPRPYGSLDFLPLSPSEVDAYFPRFIAGAGAGCDIVTGGAQQPSRYQYISRGAHDGERADRAPASSARGEKDAPRGYGFPGAPRAGTHHNPLRRKSSQASASVQQLPHNPTLS